MLEMVWRKTIWDQRRALIGWTVGIVGMLVLLLTFYPSIRDQGDELQALIDRLPEGLRALLLGDLADITSPVGYLNGRLFATTVPILMIVFTISAGTRALAGEEEAHTLDLLLSMPISRRRVVVEKFAAMTATTALLCLVLWAGVVVLDVPFGLDVAPGRVGSAVFHLFALALAFGALALALGGWIGRRSVAGGIATAVAVVSFILATIAPLADATEWLKYLSPVHYYSGSTPLVGGVEPEHVVILLSLSGIFLVAAVMLFRRRDLRA
jgi:ABC-2 type transport system permease protein